MILEHQQKTRMVESPLTNRELSEKLSIRDILETNFLSSKQQVTRLYYRVTSTIAQADTIPDKHTSKSAYMDIINSESHASMKNESPLTYSDLKARKKSWRRNTVENEMDIGTYNSRLRVKRNVNSTKDVGTPDVSKFKSYSPSFAEKLMGSINEDRESYT